MRFGIIMLKASQLLLVISLLCLYFGLKTHIKRLNDEIANLKVKIETIDSNAHEERK